MSFDFIFKVVVILVLFGLLAAVKNGFGEVLQRLDRLAAQSSGDRNESGAG